jgi:hypothetical protein
MVGISKEIIEAVKNKLQEPESKALWLASSIRARRNYKKTYSVEDIMLVTGTTNRDVAIEIGREFARCSAGIFRNGRHGMPSRLEFTVDPKELLTEVFEKIKAEEKAQRSSTENPDIVVRRARQMVAEAFRCSPAAVKIRIDL